MTGKAERVTIKIDMRMTQITCINCKKPYDLYSIEEVYLC